MTRRNAFTGIMAATGAAIAGTLKATPQPNIVRQSELQQVIDLENQAEALAVDIHRRLKAGSQLERGALGVSNVSYSDYDEAIGGNCSEGLGARGSSQSFSGGEMRARHLNCAEREWSVDVA